MKIRDIYEWKGIPIVTIILTIISFTISCMVCFVLPERFGEFCLQTKPEHIWQYVSGIFIHNIEPKWILWVHMTMNFMGLIPFGIMIEKVMGSMKTLLLFVTEMFVTAICFQVVTWNNPGQACGISTITYAFATVGFYCIVQVWKRREGSFLKQPLFYYFAFEFLGMLSMLNPMSGMTSLVMHMSGIVVGVVWVCVLKGEMNKQFIAYEQKKA